jgi:formylglycine-generating enzyme required for sulfatase activity
MTALKFVEWKNSKGVKCRIMTENEFDSLSSTLDNPKKGNSNFKHSHPVHIGFLNDYSQDGVFELFGNGWELTSSLFRPFEGFKPMEIYPEYSMDFFSDLHYVLKGASPYTSDSIVRKSFRNWYQYNYNFMTAKFRLVYED